MDAFLDKHPALVDTYAGTIRTGPQQELSPRECARWKLSEQLLNQCLRAQYHEGAFNFLASHKLTYTTREGETFQRPYTPQEWRKYREALRDHPLDPEELAEARRIVGEQIRSVEQMKFGEYLSSKEKPFDPIWYTASEEEIEARKAEWGFIKDHFGKALQGMHPDHPVAKILSGWLRSESKSHRLSGLVREYYEEFFTRYCRGVDGVERDRVTGQPITPEQDRKRLELLENIRQLEPQQYNLPLPGYMQASEGLVTAVQ